MSHFQCSRFCSNKIQGRRASLRAALAPGYLILRLRRAALANIRSIFELDVQLHFKLESNQFLEPTRRFHVKSRSTNFFLEPPSDEPKNTSTSPNPAVVFVDYGIESANCSRNTNQRRAYLYSLRDGYAPHDAEDYG